MIHFEHLIMVWLTQPDPWPMISNTVDERLSLCTDRHVCNSKTSRLWRHNCTLTHPLCANTNLLEYTSSWLTCLSVEERSGLSGLESHCSHVLIWVFALWNSFWNHLFDPICPPLSPSLSLPLSLSLSLPLALSLMAYALSLGGEIV